MNEEIEKYDFRDNDLMGFNLMGIKETFHQCRDMLIKPHRANFYIIIWFQEGSPKHLVDFDLIDIEPNTLLFLGKDVIHRFDKHTIYEGKVIIFTDHFFSKDESHAQFLRRSILFNHLPTYTKIQFDQEPHQFSTLFELLQHEAKADKKDKYHPNIIRNHLYSLLLTAERESVQNHFSNKKTTIDLDYALHFKKLLENQFREEKSVAGYAKQVHISEKRLNQATSKIFGSTPKQIINERILLEAKRLLAYSNMSVKEIGFDLGFEESTNFNKFFRKYLNTTPLHFREQAQAPD